MKIVSRVIQDIQHWPYVLAYAGGFAAGTLLGLYLAEVLARQVVQATVISNGRYTKKHDLANHGCGPTRQNSEPLRGTLRLRRRRPPGLWFRIPAMVGPFVMVCGTMCGAQARFPRRDAGEQGARGRFWRSQQSRSQWELSRRPERLGSKFTQPLPKSHLLVTHR